MIDKIVVGVKVIQFIAPSPSRRGFVERSGREIKVNVFHRGFSQREDLTSSTFVASTSASVKHGGRFDIPRAKSVRKEKGSVCRIERAEGVKVK